MNPPAQVAGRLTVRDLGHVSFFVRDLDAARGFYMGGLALETGLYHVAFAVGTTPDEPTAARRWVESHGLTPFGDYERGFCIRDPDGHEIELYVGSRP